MPVLLKERMRELLAEHPRPEKYQSELPNEYDAALQDVIDALESLHLAVLFDAPPGEDARPSGIAIMPDAYLRIQDRLRKAMRMAGYDPGRTSPLIDSVLRSLLGDPEIHWAQGLAPPRSEEVKENEDRGGDEG